MKRRSFGLALAACVLATAPWAFAAAKPPLWATVGDPPPLPRPDESGLVTTADGARLYYGVFHKGGGSPVLLLHGGLSASDTWGFEVPRLIGRHEVIVMDTRGHGRSTLGAQPLTFDLMTSDVVAVMDALHLRRASIVGASDGAIVGLMLAIRHPDRVDRLFAWGANFNSHSDRTSPPDPAMRPMGATYMAKMQAQYRRLSPSPDGFAALRKALGQLYASEPNLTPAELGRITAPTVIADGEYEQFIDPGHTALLARLVPHAELLILPGVSHGGPQQAPDAFHHAVAALLDSKGAGGSPGRPRGGHAGT